MAGRLVKRQSSILLFHKRNWTLGTTHNIICNTSHMMDQSFFPTGCDYNRADTIALLLFQDRFTGISHFYVDGNLDVFGKSKKYRID